MIKIRRKIILFYLKIRTKILNFKIKKLMRIYNVDENNLLNCDVELWEDLEKIGSNLKNENDI